MKQHGFSLVELSIVLVILGLLVGGVLAGKFLIRASELRSVSSDLIKYKTAIYSFRDRYFGLPGDITNATQFWGSVTTSGATCPYEAGTGTQTCDGNGEGNIQYYSEHARAWQQLANAGLIEGSFSGSPASANFYGETIPASKITGNGYMFIYTTKAAIGLTGAGTASTNNTIRFGSGIAGTYPSFRPNPPTINSIETWNLDTKIDDGMPGSGKLYNHIGTATTVNCVTGGTDVGVITYNMVTTTQACFPHFEFL